MTSEAIDYSQLPGAHHSVLVVDDEQSIRRSLEVILQDDGFTVMGARNGSEALELIQSGVRPSLVLLDIWMAGLDGIETLKRIKAIDPSLPVIMISGHATIGTAVEATRLGAADFIEKPLDLKATLIAIKRALGRDQKAQEPVRQQSEAGPAESLSIGGAPEVEYRSPLVFSKQAWPGRAVKQKTLAHSALLYGHGVHTGQKSGLILEPLPPNSGIHFAGALGNVSMSNTLPAHVNYVESTGYATCLRRGETRVGTIEHLLSALHAYGISNLLVKCNTEVPVMDGSSAEFCKLIADVGVVEQEGDWFAIKVKEKIRVGDDREFIQLEPGEGFTVDYTLEYSAPLGKQHMKFELGNVELYKEEIAPARTFGFVKDIGALQARGLAQGGRFDNFVLYGDDGAINGALRFEDEAVRHKILDLIGDLYLLGRPFDAKVTARMTGHSDNVKILQQLKAAMKNSPA